MTKALRRFPNGVVALLESRCEGVWTALSYSFVKLLPEKEGVRCLSYCGIMTCGR